MMKSALITLCVLLVSGCAAKYEGNFLHSVELIDNSLLIVGDHSTGLQKPTFGSHKSGLTINSQTFFLAEYDVSAAPPKLKSINFLFRSSDEDAGYSFKIVSTNTVLVIKSLPGGTACVEKLIVSTGGRGEICVSNSLGRIGHTAFIFNRSGSHFVANHKGFEMYSTLTLAQVSNTLSGVFSRPDLAREIGGAELRLSDDLKYLITFPERPQNEVRFLGNDQEPLVKRMYSQDNCTSRDAESLTNRLGWF
jgi:hypothetical protein